MSKENTIEEILESTKDIKKVDLNPYLFNKILLKIKLNKDIFLLRNHFIEHCENAKNPAIWIFSSNPLN